MEQSRISPTLKVLRITLSDKNRENYSGKYVIIKDNKALIVPHRNVEICFATTKNSMISDCIKVLNSISGTENIESINLTI